MTKYILIGIIGICAAAIGFMGVNWDSHDAIAQTQTVIKANLFDPDSAQFKDLIFYRNGDRRTVCGKVDSRNKFGGYVGYKSFIYWAHSQKLLMTDHGNDESEVATMCKIAKIGSEMHDAVIAYSLTASGLK